MTAEPADPLPGFDPLVLTVVLDPLAQAFFDRMRQRHFPPSRNVLSAHVTMFHHLPGERESEIATAVAASCLTLPPCPVGVTGLRFLGRGTAYTLAIPGLAALRREYAARWAPWLTPQDRQPWQPHVTVQNKVPGPEAKQLHATLLAGFTPFDAEATGLHLWGYRGGPWQSVLEAAFTGVAGG